MTSETQAATTATVTKLDPTLNSIRQEREDAAAKAAAYKAEQDERRRVAEKRELLGQVLNMQADIEKRFEAVKAQKKLLKGLKLDLEVIADDEDLTAEDLTELLKRGHEAYDVGGADAFAAVAGVAALIAGALGGRAAPSKVYMMAS